MLMSSLDTCFLEVSAHTLLKVATKSSFRGKNYRNLAFLGYFSEVKTESMTRLNYVLFIILERSYLGQIHTFWKSVHVFLIHNIFAAIGSSEWEVKEFHVEILFWNYKRLSIQLRSSRPALLCKEVIITSQNSLENIYAGVSLLIMLSACGL